MHIAAVNHLAQLQQKIPNHTVTDCQFTESITTQLVFVNNSLVPIFTLKYTF